MRLKYLDLVAGASIIVLTLAVAALGIWTGANRFGIWFLPFGLLMVLFVPGYMVTLAILLHLDRATTLLLSLGISISLDILGGLILHYTPWGLQPFSWAIWLTAISLPSCLVAAYRRSLSSSVIIDRISTSGWDSKVIFRFLLTAIIIGLSIFIARFFAIQSGNTFTQLWALPAANENGYTVEVGIHNQETDTIHYSLLLESRGMTIDQWTDIELAPGETWTTSVAFMEKPGHPITFRLYKTNTSNEEYRTVRIVPASFETISTPSTRQ